MSPRLALLRTVGGHWSDYSRVQYDRVGPDTVISFAPSGRGVLQSLIDRHDFIQGRHPGNGDEVAESLLTRAGYYANDYYLYHQRQPRGGLRYLFVSASRCVVVEINY
jgi:hypothetical protein